MHNNAIEDLSRYCEARERHMDMREQLELDHGLESHVVAALTASQVHPEALADMVSRKLGEAATYRGKTLGGGEVLASEMSWARRRAIEVNRSGLKAQVSELAELVGPVTMLTMVRPLCAPRPVPKLAFSDEEAARPRP